MRIEVLAIDGYGIERVKLQVDPDHDDIEGNETDVASEDGQG